MSRILFEISYDVIPEYREDFLTAVRELQKYIKDHADHDYFVVEDRSKPNNFTEIYVCKDEAEYESLDDGMDETMQVLTSEIASRFIAGGKTRYSTRYEI